jgi:hypothetical protein
MKKFFACFLLALIVVAPLAAQKSEKAVAVVSQDAALTVIQSGKTLQLQNATIGDKLEVLSIVGVRVYEKKIDSTNQVLNLDLPKGYYIVKVGNAVRKISVK